MLVVWSDKFEAMKDTRHALTITVMNVSLQHALKFYGTRLLAVLPKIVVRMPHGTNQEEGMDQDQQTLKRQLLISAIARALAAGNTPDGVRHRMRSGNIVFLHYRLFAYIMDLEEQWLVCATRHGHSNRDLSHKQAHTLSPKLPNTFKLHNGKPFLLCASDDMRKYADKHRRSPPQHLQLQQDFLQMQDRQYAAADADKLQTQNGVFAEVDQQLHRLHHLVRWETGGLYGALAFDYLHTFGLGIYRKFITVLDAVFRRFYKRSPEININTVEDVRDLWDKRLGSVPPFFDGMRRLLTWKHWWAENNGTISGDDYEAVLLQLCYVYANCSVLIGDDAVRTTVVTAHTGLLNIMSELRMPAWRDESEFDRLDAQLVEVVGHLKEVQLLLEAPWRQSHKKSEKDDGNCPGHGFDIPKVRGAQRRQPRVARSVPVTSCTQQVVEMLHAARDMQRRGFPSTYSAASKECVGVKEMKRAVLRTTRHRSGTFGRQIFTRSACNDELRRLADAEAAVADDDGDYDFEHTADLDPQLWPSIVNTSRIKGEFQRHSIVWGRVCDSLVGGNSGPKIGRTHVDGLLPLIRQAIGHAAILFDTTHRQFYPSMRIALSADRKLTLSSGVCVLLGDGNYAQVIAVMKPSPPQLPCAVLVPFKHVIPDGDSQHPAFGRIWLARDMTYVRIVPFTEVLHRACLVPVMGGLHPTPDVDGRGSPETYVVDETLWWRNFKDPRTLRSGQEPIFRVCPTCAHHVPQPVKTDDYIACPGCITLLHW